MDQILFIAPSQVMANIAKESCASMGLEIPIEVGINQQALDVVENYSKATVIVSRGGNVEYLRKSTNKTVVGITATISDLLPPIHKIAMKGISKIGIVVTERMLDDAEQDLKLANVEIYLRPWKNKEAVKASIGSLKAQGVIGIVGDKTGVEIAKSYGLTAEFFDSGPSSIKKAISEAVQITKAQATERLREAAKAQQIRQYVDEIYQALEQTTAAIQQLSASTQELAATSQVSANMVQTASREVSNSAEILNMIRRVAQQTNLLGLNAGIEAARVGELGRGFSVVANEVRKLADESNSSAQHITSILDKIRTAVEQVLTNVAQSNQISQQQAKAVQDIAQMVEGLQLTGHKLMEMAAIKS